MCGHRCPRHRKTDHPRDGRRNGAGDTPCLINAPAVAPSPEQGPDGTGLPAATGRRIPSSALWKPASGLPAKTGRFSLPGDLLAVPLLAVTPSESSPRGTPNQAVAAGFRSADKIGAQARSSPRGTAADLPVDREPISGPWSGFPSSSPRGTLAFSGPTAQISALSRHFRIGISVATTNCEIFDFLRSHKVFNLLLTIPGNTVALSQHGAAR